MTMRLMVVSLLLGATLAGAEENRLEGWQPVGRMSALGEGLAEQGLDVGLGMTYIYQFNARGGLSTHARRGRHAGSYDVELTADMARWLGVDGGSLYVHAEGWWSRSQGIDGPSVGSAFGVNGDAMPRDALVVTEMYWEQRLLDGTLLLRIGKMDPTGGFECHGRPVAFDGNAYANDELCQFLNGALVNNPTIPFPDYALGVAVHWEPWPGFYASGAVLDAQNDHRETGFRTAFHDEDYYFYIAETGFTPQFESSNGPLQGAYRVGVWNDPQPKGHADAVRTYRDDTGLYLSCDQMLAKENADPEDAQGLGMFFRYGYAPSRANDLARFWSIGLQYQGLFEGRDEDVLGAGYAHGAFSDHAAATYPQDYESVLEVYYNLQVAEGINVTPSLQYVSHPGGASGVSDAVVLGLRTQVTF
ncbi:MAG TPA: carbohydrate porin [Phycisphaerales bacterium]|nr:carbohydrate porin [Phycisphaerales bacterium]